MAAFVGFLTSALISLQWVLLVLVCIIFYLSKLNKMRVAWKQVLSDNNSVVSGGGELEGRGTALRIDLFVF